MPFEYVGLESLATPGILDQVLISSVEDTGLIYDFNIRGGLRSVGPAIDYFQHHAFFFLSGEDLSTHRAMLGIAALAIHSVAMHPIFDTNLVFLPNHKIIGLHEGAIRKNPNEAIALTFGLSLVELQAACIRRPDGLIMSPMNINLSAISETDIRDAIRVIAENRNRDIRADNGQFRRTFLRLRRLILKLQARRKRPRR